MNGEGKMEETFTAGIRPGGLTDGREIRILICHILSEIGEPMGFDEMTEAILSDGAANYFEFADALSDLRESGCVVAFKTESGINEYTVTEKGRTVARSLENNIPLSVKEKSLENSKNIIQRRRIEKENLVSITKTEDGYMIHIRVTDIGTDLMDLSLFMPTREQALAVKEKFLGDPAGAYMGVLETLAGEF
jgi:predicted transcriptional regulator